MSEDEKVDAFVFDGVMYSRNVFNENIFINYEKGVLDDKCSMFYAINKKIERVVLQSVNCRFGNRETLKEEFPEFFI